MNDTVGINIEGDFNLGDATGRWRDADQRELAEHLVVAGHFTFALVDLDFDLGLTVGRRGEHLALLRGDGRVPVDQPGEDAAQRFDTEGQGSYVEEEHVRHVAGQYSTLHGSTWKTGG